MNHQNITSVNKSTGGPLLLPSPPPNEDDKETLPNTLCNPNERWSLAEQAQLESLLEQVPVDKYPPLKRYVHIAGQMESKSVRDVALRAKWIQQQKAASKKRKLEEPAVLLKRQKSLRDKSEPRPKSIFSVRLQPSMPGGDLMAGGAPTMGGVLAGGVASSGSLYSAPHSHLAPSPPTTSSASLYPPITSHPQAHPQHPHTRHNTANNLHSNNNNNNNSHLNNNNHNNSHNNNVNNNNNKGGNNNNGNPDSSSHTPQPLVHNSQVPTTPPAPPAHLPPHPIQINTVHCAVQIPQLEDHGADTVGSLGGESEELLEENLQVINQIRNHWAACRIVENGRLLSQLRDNIVKILSSMSSMPGIMAQMPQLPVKLHLELASHVLPVYTSSPS